MESQIRIVSAALNGIFCKYGYEHTVQENTTNKVNIDSKVPIHDDMRTAFNGLNPHLAAICEEVNIGDRDIEKIPVYNPDVEDNDPLAEKISKFHVTAIKITGDGENEGVTLIGFKVLSNGEEVKLETPRIKYEDSDYAYLQELRIAIDAVVAEVEEYMNGKQAPRIIQTEMEFEEEEDK